MVVHIKDLLTILTVFLWLLMFAFDRVINCENENALPSHDQLHLLTVSFFNLSGRRVLSGWLTVKRPNDGGASRRPADRDQAAADGTGEVTWGHTLQGELDDAVLLGQSVWTSRHKCCELHWCIQVHRVNVGITLKAIKAVWTGKIVLFSLNIPFLSVKTDLNWLILLTHKFSVYWKSHVGRSLISVGVHDGSAA